MKMRSYALEARRIRTSYDKKGWKMSAIEKRVIDAKPISEQNFKPYGQVSTVDQCSTLQRILL